MAETTELRSLLALNRRALREHGWAVAVAASLLVAAAIPVACFLVLWPLTTAMPTWDQWNLVEAWQAHSQQRPVLPLLLGHYNGHYAWIPRLLFFGVGLLTAWNVKVEVLLSYLAALATLLLVLRMMWETRPRILVLAAPLSACVFSLAQFENFLSGYPLGEMLGQLFATATILLLSRPRTSHRAFAGALACGVAATLSYGTEIVVWPVGLLLLLAAWRERHIKLRLAFWLAASVGGFAMVRSAAASMGASILWAPLVPFWLAMTGTPLSMSPAPRPAVVMAQGVFLLAAFAALTVPRLAASWRPAGPVRMDPLRIDPVLWRWGAYGLLTVGSGFLVAAGRGYAGIQQALASHYVTLAWPLVVAVLVLALDSGLRAAADRPARMRRVAWATALAAGALIAQTAWISVQLLPILRTSAQIIARNNLRLVNGTATDAEIHQTHHPDAAYVRAGLQTLRDLRLAWFRDAATASTIKGRLDLVNGKPWAEPAPVRARLGEAWTFEGWAAQSEGDSPVIVTELEVNRVAVASAPVALHRPDVEQFFGAARYRRTGWRLEFPGAALLPEGGYSVGLTARDGQGNQQAIAAVTIEIAPDEPAAAASPPP